MGNRTITFLLIVAAVALITFGLSIDAWDDQSIRRPTPDQQGDAMPTALRDN